MAATAEFSFKLSPEDYETEEEYNAALADLKARGEDEFSVEDCIPLRSIYESGAYPPPKVAPVKVRPQNSKPAEPPAPPPPELQYQSPGIQPRTAIGICVALVLCLLLILFCGVRKYRQTNAVRQAYIDEVKAVCMAYGLDTVQVSIRQSEEKYIWMYYPDINVSGIDSLSLRDQYALVKQLLDLEIGRTNKTGVTIATVHSGGQKYDIDPQDNHALRVNGEDVYPVPTQKPSSTWSSKSHTSSSSSKTTATTTKKTTTTTKSTTTKKTTTTWSDPFDVQDYSDPEEFYYYHYDDFYDYEDAEDYFNEHG